MVPKLNLLEVHYEAHIGMPNGRVPPFPFGMSTRRTGGGNHVPEDMRFQTL